jgi:hypothetical protein
MAKDDGCSDGGGIPADVVEEAIWCHQKVIHEDSCSAHR